MLPPIELTPEQYERLKIARATKKFGHLESWKELFIFQYTIGNQKQIKIIAQFAHRKNNGEIIRLPLATYHPEQDELIKE